MKSYKAYTSDGAFLKKADVDPPLILTVTGAAIRSIAAPGKPAQQKLVLSFKETSKVFPVNTVNGDAICEITGSEDADKWAETRLEFFVDPNVTFAGQKRGGIRVRKPSTEPF
jgi:hypothetical protein